MWISRYICIFIIYSFMGWVYETIYCTVKSGKWENRGFLYGPICPIYGTGAVAITVIMKLALEKGIQLSVWQVFIISVLGSAVLEYATSWTLEKLFHAVWWDYSDLPFNLHGRISLFTSLGFGLGGLLIVYGIAPFIARVVGQIPAIMMELLALCATFVLAVDVTLTVTALHHFDRVVLHIEESFNHRMETVVDTAVQQSNRIRENVLGNGRFVSERLYSLGDISRDAIRRIHSFRDKNQQRETVRNSLLQIIQRVTKHRTEQESKEEG